MIRLAATPKGLRRSLRIIRKPLQLLQSCGPNKHALYSQGFKANPGLEFANTFGVIVDHTCWQWRVLVSGRKKQAKHHKRLYHSLFNNHAVVLFCTFSI